MPAKFKSREDMIQKFWKAVNTGLPNECWNWLGAKDNKGYGRLSRVTYGVTLAHRFSYEITYGPISNGLFTCHKCDNPSCVNPKHLWLGTNADNIQDSLKKGRGYLRGQSTMRGESNGFAKLTSKQVTEIRADYATGNISLAALGRRCGVSDQNIWRIVHRLAWAHL